LLQFDRVVADDAARRQAMSVNAYLQRTANIDLEFDLHMEIPDKEHLDINYATWKNQGNVGRWSLQACRQFRLLPRAEEAVLLREEAEERQRQVVDEAAGSDVELCEQRYEYANNHADLRYTIGTRDEDEESSNNEDEGEEAVEGSGPNQLSLPYSLSTTTADPHLAFTQDQISMFRSPSTSTSKYNLNN
jgi:hypothetical protein